MRFKVSFEIEDDVEREIKELDIPKEFLEERKEYLLLNINTWIKSEIMKTLKNNKFENINNFKIEVEE